MAEKQPQRYQQLTRAKKWVDTRGEQDRNRQGVELLGSPCVRRKTNRKILASFKVVPLSFPPLFLLCRPNYVHMLPRVACHRNYGYLDALPQASRLGVMDAMTSAYTPTAELGFVPQFDVLQFLIL